LNRPRAYLLLALDGGNIVGMVLGHLSSRIAAHLSTLGVIEERRHQGIGMALLGRCLQRIIEEWPTIRRITLEAEPRGGTDHIMQKYFHLAPLEGANPWNPGSKIHQYTIGVPAPGFRDFSRRAA
jgi:hypothetical protein